MQVKIRPLSVEDAKKSYQWRADPTIWVLTGRKPTQEVTYEMELKWIQSVLSRDNELRFAICVGKDLQYIGNVQLTSMTDIEAELHIFIGEKCFHNKGIATIAINQMIDYVKEKQLVTTVYLFVNQKHHAAIKVYEKCGFLIDDNSNDDSQFKMYKQLR